MFLNHQLQAPQLENVQHILHLNYELLYFNLSLVNTVPCRGHLRHLEKMRLCKIHLSWSRNKSFLLSPFIIRLFKICHKQDKMNIASVFYVPDIIEGMGHFSFQSSLKLSTYFTIFENVKRQNISCSVTDSNIFSNIVKVVIF